MKIVRYIVPATVFLALVLAAATATARGGAAAKGGANIAAKSENSENSAHWMYKAVENHLAENFSPPVADWRIVQIKLPPARLIPPVFDNYRLDTGHSSANGKTLTIVINFYKEGRFFKQLYTIVKLELFADLVVATAPIKRGSVITPDKLTISRKEIGLPVDDFCTEIAQVTGQLAKRNIIPGRLLLKSEVAPVPEIRSGEIVTIVAESGNVRVTARGIAKSDGSLGQTIPVVSLRSNKKIFARVLGGGTVQVAF